MRLERVSAMALASGVLLALASVPASGGEPPGDRWQRRCQNLGSTRWIWPQGTALWGTHPLRPGDENSGVLAAASLRGVRFGAGELALEGGRLVEKSGKGVVGTVLRGESSSGRSVDVAICGEEPVAGEPDMAWYRLQIWNASSQEWENPCTGTKDMADPRALAVAGTWDRAGARSDAPGKITFACENGAIAKCVRWGYKPWKTAGGQPVAPLHQACTRMARADYCGNGTSHTQDATLVDIYDSRGLLARTTSPTARWQPDRASFEAAWGPDGAVCLARTRDDRPVDAILKECPGRFSRGPELDLGDGDRCSLRRDKTGPAGALLRNRSYPASAARGG